MKKFLLVILLLIILAIGLWATLSLTKERQEIRKKAAVPQGEATVSLSPTTGTYEAGQSFQVSIFFNTAGIAISGISVRVTYPYGGTTPELAASGLQLDSSFLAGGNWMCPVKSIDSKGGMVKIDIACVNVNTAINFSTTTSTPFASFNLVAQSIPATNPTIFRFDPAKSVIVRKSDGQDVLLTPTSTGTYTIAGEGIGGAGFNPSPTPTTTPRVVTPTPTPRVTTPTPAQGGQGGTTPITGQGTLTLVFVLVGFSLLGLGIIKLILLP